MLSPYQFTIEAYYKLMDIGILKAEEKVELLEGQIIQRIPNTSSHAACIEKLGDLLRSLLLPKRAIRQQNPITLSLYSEPVPDLAVVTYQKDYYEGAHPTPKQVYLIIEVAQNMERLDRDVKMPLYAKHNIAEAWLVNLNKKEIEVYQQPTKTGYNLKTIYKINDKLQFDYLKKSLAVKRIFKI